MAKLVSPRVQGSQGRIENLVSNNSGLSAGDGLTAWRLKSGPPLALLKAYQKISVCVCVRLSFGNPEH